MELQVLKYRKKTENKMYVIFQAPLKGVIIYFGKCISYILEMQHGLATKTPYFMEVYYLYLSLKNIK